MTDLGNLTGHPFRIAGATGVNADGTVVVGYWGVNLAGGLMHAFRWRQGIGMENLGSLGENVLLSNIRVSADGSTVVGSSGTPGGQVRPFLWTAQTGMLNLQTYLPSIGVNLTGWSLCSAMDISADGRTIVGNACGSPGGTAGFIIHLPAVLPMCITLGAVSDTRACLGSATFSVTATGTGPFTYQWRRNSILIDTSPSGNPTAATGTLMLTNLTAADAATFDCIVSNACGTATSNAATLRICTADFNCSGALEVQDIFQFLAAWFASDPHADFNGTDGLGVQDIFDFLAAWFGGC